MDWWPKEEEIWRMFEQTAQQTEEFLDQLGLGLDKATIELEEVLDLALAPVVTVFLDLDQSLTEWTQPLAQRINPWLDQQPVCMGCSHYHGQMYGDTFFVCAMHPYGAQMQSCPDWEA
ncbi:MAG: hypothetical protein HC934_03690 [Acaryochloridaceae cyanobacterium SU_2_1]|nr:hypothetical protein [Acaryochloridaceae cyanobacterium SU_2_1]